MGLADIVRGRAEETQKITVLEGKVDDVTGDIKLDTTDLTVLGARLKEVRNEIKPLKKEEERLKKLILGHPDAKAGYGNAHISITPSDGLDLEDPELLAALYTTKTLGEALNMALSIPKVRKIAEREKSVADVLKTLAGRKITTT